MHLETQYNFSREQLETFAAHVMHLTVGHLVETKVIDETSRDEIVNSTTPVIVLRQSMLDYLAEKLFKTKQKKDLVDFKIKFVTFKLE